jgi:hypothetical protein
LLPIFPVAQFVARFKREEDPIELPGSEVHTKTIFKLSAKAQRTGHEELVLGIATTTTKIQVALPRRPYRTHHALRATIENEKEPRNMEMKILRCERSFL